MHLDLRTALLLTSFCALMMSIGMLVTARFYPSHIRGRKRWGWACALQAICWALISFRGDIPDWLSIVVANTLIVFSLVLFYQAVCEFQEKPFNRTLPCVVVGIVLLVLIFFTHVRPNLNVRVIATSSGGGIFALKCAYSLLLDYRSPRVFSRWATGLFFLLFGLISTIRVAYLSVTNPIPSLFTRGLVQDALSISLFSGVIILSFGFLLMVNERFSTELSQALRDVKTLRGMLPICAYCKNIRDDQNYWQRIEAYITDHTDAEFTHSVCPGCYSKVVQPQLDAFRAGTSSGSSTRPFD